MFDQTVMEIFLEAQRAFADEKDQAEAIKRAAAFHGSGECDERTLAIEAAAEMVRAREELNAELRARGEILPVGSEMGHA